MRHAKAVLPAATLALWSLLSFGFTIAAEAADPSIGRRLFSGEIPFREGGAPCAACHRVGLLPDGGTLGPDLTKTFADYGADGMESILADLSFPSMKALYDGRPLSPEERGHLAAFMRDASAAGAVRGADRLMVHGLAGALIVVAIAAVAGRRRLRDVRRTLLRGSRGPEGGGG